MKASLKKLLQSELPAPSPPQHAEPQPSANGRRSFLKKAGLGGISMAAVMHLPVADQVAYASQHVRRSSSPSDLKITDMRVAEVGNVPIIRLYTNQDIVGHGDVRDGADARYALFLKSRILGENPCNVEMLFRRIKQFGGQARQAG